MLEWLIIGGGIHGTHLSFVLHRRAGVRLDCLRVLDPHPEPLARWHDVTRNTGMTFLRSPHVHNLHYDQGALVTYARIHEKAPYTRFIPPYSRPTLELFNRHSAHLIERYRLGSVRMRGYARHIRRVDGGWQVETDRGSISARRVALAIGMGEQWHIPRWAQDLPDDRVRHIFQTGFDAQEWREVVNWRQMAVIGGGITAVQAALSFAERQPGTVTLIARHPVRPHDFDSDPGWMNAIYLRDYARIADPNQRRATIRAARHRGSVPPDVRRDLQEATASGTLRMVHAQVVAAQADADGHICLTLTDGQAVRCDRLILATGYDQHRPGGALVDRLIEDYALPVADCGYPIPDRGLKWAEGLYVSGALAELEAGPAARNIIGARMAGERLARA